MSNRRIFQQLHATFLLYNHNHQPRPLILLIITRTHITTVHHSISDTPDQHFSTLSYHTTKFCCCGESAAKVTDTARANTAAPTNPQGLPPRLAFAKDRRAKGTESNGNFCSGSIHVFDVFLTPLHYFALSATKVRT